METILTIIVVLLIPTILGAVIYLFKPATTCKHSWDKVTVVDNDETIIIENTCKNCGKITANYYYKTLNK